MKSRRLKRPSRHDRQGRRSHLAAIAMVSILLGLVPIGLAATGSSPAQAAQRIPATTIAPRGITILAGSNATLSLAFASSRPSNVSFVVEALPSGVSAELGCSAPWLCAVTLRAAQSAPEATSLVEIVLRSGSSNRRVPFALHVKPVAIAPPPTTTPTPVTVTTVPGTAGRSLSLRPVALITTIRPGTRASFNINIVRNGWSGPVAMVVDSLPPSWRAAYIPNPSSSDLVTLILDTPTNAAVGDYPIRISGRSDALLAESILVVRLRAPEIAMTLLSSGPAVIPGGTTRYLLDVRSTDDPNRPVNVRAEGLPLGVTASINPNPTIGTVTADISVGMTVSQAVYGFSFVASVDGAADVRLPVFLSVLSQTTSSFRFQPTRVTPVPGDPVGYGLSASTGTVSLSRGTPSSFDVTVVPKGGFADPIDVSLATPTAWSISWAAVGPNVFRVTILATSAAATGNTTLSLATVSGALAASLTLSAVVS